MEIGFSTLLDIDKLTLCISLDTRIQEVMAR